MKKSEYQRLSFAHVIILLVFLLQYILMLEELPSVSSIAPPQGPYDLVRGDDKKAELFELQPTMTLEPDPNFQVFGLGYRPQYTPNPLLPRPKQRQVMTIASNPTNDTTDKQPVKFVEPFDPWGSISDEERIEREEFNALPLTEQQRINAGVMLEKIYEITQRPETSELIDTATKKGIAGVRLFNHQDFAIDGGHVNAYLEIIGNDKIKYYDRSTEDPAVFYSLVEPDPIKENPNSAIPLDSKGRTYVEVDSDKPAGIATYAEAAERIQQPSFNLPSVENDFRRLTERIKQTGETWEQVLAEDSRLREFADREREKIQRTQYRRVLYNDLREGELSSFLFPDDVREEMERMLAYSAHFIRP